MITVADSVLLIAVIALGVLAIRNTKRTSVMKRRLSDHAFEITRLEKTILIFQRAARERELRSAHADRYVESKPKLLAGRGEDLLLLDLFEHEPPGTFLECGAYDGVRYSCTYALAQLGWKGVLVEAIPEFAEHARQHRPESVVVESGVSRRGAAGTATFTILSNETPGGDTASFLTNNEAHQKVWRKQIRDQARRIEVSVRDMDSILAGTGVDHVDAAVLDVEGAELDLLDGFDLDRWRVRCLVIEELSKGRDTSLRTEMDRRGYAYVARIARNDVYVRRDDPMMQRAEALCLQA